MTRRDSEQGSKDKSSRYRSFLTVLGTSATDFSDIRTRRDGSISPYLEKIRVKDILASSYHPSWLTPNTFKRLSIRWEDTMDVIPESSSKKYSCRNRKYPRSKKCKSPEVNDNDNDDLHFHNKIEREYKEMRALLIQQEKRTDGQLPRQDVANDTNNIEQIHSTKRNEDEKVIEQKQDLKNEDNLINWYRQNLDANDFDTTGSKIGRTDINDSDTRYHPSFRDV